MDDRFEDAVGFALENLQKPSLKLSVYQKEALKNILSGKDTFVCLPTGHGKSIIFECSPLCHDYLSEPGPSSSVLVVSPLISLMTSQVDDLRKRNQSAVRLSHELAAADEEKLREGRFRYVFSAPEALAEGRWRAMFTVPTYSKSIMAVFFDEAHCVEIWGGGVDPFRRSYSKLASIQSFLAPKVPFVTLTATATNNTRTKICKLLNMVDPAVIGISPNRSNIRYSCVHCPPGPRFTWLLEELRSKKLTTTKTIVFCRSIENCAHLYQMFDFGLKEDGYIPSGKMSIRNALFGMYHAKVTDYEKRALLHSFSEPDGVCRVMFCTVAFGMGVNIPDVYRVFHDGPAESIEQYIQETGRGGRDGNVCEAVLYLFSGSTRGKISSNMKTYCKNNEECRRKQLMQYFPGQSVYKPHFMHLCCDVCTRRCLCNCLCETCHCTDQHSPCVKCCTCSYKCTFIPPTVAGMGLEPAADLEHQSDSEEEILVSSCPDSSEETEQC